MFCQQFAATACGHVPIKHIGFFSLSLYPYSSISLTARHPIQTCRTIRAFANPEMLFRFKWSMRSFFTEMLLRTRMLPSWLPRPSTVDRKFLRSYIPIWFLACLLMSSTCTRYEFIELPSFDRKESLGLRPGALNTAAVSIRSQLNL